MSFEIPDFLKKLVGTDSPQGAQRAVKQEGQNEEIAGKQQGLSEVDQAESNIFSATVIQYNGYDTSVHSATDADGNKVTRSTDFKFDSENQMEDLIKQYYGDDLTESEKYSAATAIIDNNLEELMPSINETYLASQVTADISKALESENLDDAQREFIYSAATEIANDPDKSLVDLAKEANLKYSELPLAARQALGTVQNKSKNDKYEQFEEPYKTDDIPPEVIFATDFSGADISGGVFLPSISTLEANYGVHLRETSLDVGFESQATDNKLNLKIDLNDSKYENMTEEEKDADIDRLISEQIAANYGLVDDLDDPLSLNSFAGATILSGIALDTSNNTMFDDTEEDPAGVIAILREQVKANNGELEVACPDVNMSVLGNSYNDEEAREYLTKERDQDINFSYLHVSQESVSVSQEDITTGLDLLDKVTYGDGTLKQAIEDAILTSVDTDKYGEMTLEEAIQAAKENKDESLYGDLKLLYDSGDYTTGTINDAVKEIKESGRKYIDGGKDSYDLDSIKSLGATALEQIYDNNPALKGAEEHDSKGNNVDYLLGLDVKKYMDEANVDVVDLENIRYTKEATKKAAATPAKPSTPAQPETPAETPDTPSCTCPDPEPTPTPSKTETVTETIPTPTPGPTVTTTTTDTVTDIDTVTKTTTDTVTNTTTDTVTNTTTETVTNTTTDTVTNTTTDTVTNTTTDTVTDTTTETITNTTTDTVTDTTTETVTNTTTETVTCDPEPDVDPGNQDDDENKPDEGEDPIGGPTPPEEPDTPPEEPDTPPEEPDTPPEEPDTPPEEPDTPPEEPDTPDEGCQDTPDVDTGDGNIGGQAPEVSNPNPGSGSDSSGEDSVPSAPDSGSSDSGSESSGGGEPDSSGGGEPDSSGGSEDNGGGDDSSGGEDSSGGDDSSDDIEE